MKRILLFLSFSWWLATAYTQPPAWEGGLLAIGVSSMGGDLVDPKWGTTKGLSYAFGVMGRRSLNANWAIRTNLLHTVLKGDDQWSAELSRRGFSARTPLTELSVDVQWDILGHKRNQEGAFRPGLSPYLTVGLGMAFINPDPTFNFRNGSMQQRIEQDKNADANGPHLVIPFGVGVRWQISPRWALAWELAPRAVSTDYLDGVSIAGNPGEKDGYGISGLKLWYRFSDADAGASAAAPDQ